MAILRGGGAFFERTPPNAAPRQTIRVECERGAANEVIAMPTAETPPTANDSPNRSGAPISAEAVAEVLRGGPTGAYIVAGIAVGILLIGWLMFYFLLFMPRGSIG
jgi:hypothetical protein